MAHGHSSKDLVADYGAAGNAGHMLMGGHGPQALHAPSKLKDSQRSRMSVPALVALIFVPWITFVIVLWSRSMWLRYFYPWLSLGLAVYFLIFVMVVGVMFVNSVRDSAQGNPKTLGSAFAFCALAWILAVGAGEDIFAKYTREYYDFAGLNIYPSVDPSKYAGAQLMDAGVIEFTDDAKLNTTMSIGFKNGDIYCVAPVVVQGEEMESYDFWAVGINCCGAHPIDNYYQSSYRCGEYNIPNVHKGLRLMSDEQRPFFRLAVMEAEANFNIEAKHPVFLHWLADPAGEAEAYQDDAQKFFVFSIFSFLAAMIFLSGAASVILNSVVR